MAPFGLTVFGGVFEKFYCSSVYEKFFEIFDILYGWNIFWIIMYYCSIVFEKMINPNAVIMCHFGVPKMLITDNSKNLNDDMVDGLCE